MIWRRILIISSVVVSIFTVRAIVLSCAYELEPEYSRVFFFLPENGKDIDQRWWFSQNATLRYRSEKELETGFLINLTNDKENRIKPAYDSTKKPEDVLLPVDIESLCKEWNVLLGGNYDLQSIAEVVFYRSVIKNESLMLDETARPSSYKVLEAFKKNKSYYDYLLIAKDIEVFSMDAYYISEEQLKTDSIQYAKFIKVLMSKLDLVRNDKALYEKYLYQIVKLSAIYHDYSLLKPMYEQFKKVNQSITLQGWGALYYQYTDRYSKDIHKRQESNLLLARIMNMAPGKKSRCIEMFDVMEDISYINEVKDSVLRANLLSMQAIGDYRPNMNYVSEIAALYPNNVLLSTLITREINKYEDYKFSKKYTGHEVLGNSAGKIKYEAAFSELIIMLNKLSQTENIEETNKVFFQIALGHCLALAGKEDEALILLESIKTDYPPHIVQKLISRLFILSGRDLSNQKNLDQITELIIESYTLGRGGEDVNRCISSVLLKIHKALMDKNKVALAGLCLLRSNMIMVTDSYFTNYTWFELNATHAEFNELERILLKENKTKMEILLTGDLSIYSIYNSRAKVYLRECDLDNAIKYLKKLPEWYLAKKYNYIIEANVLFQNSEKDDIEVIEALELLNGKIKLVESIQDNNLKAYTYLAIGNAFFQLSNRGEYPFTSGYYSTGYAPRSVKEIKAKRPDAFYDFYYKAKPAFSYYEKAKQCSTNKETSAAIQYYYMKAFDRVYTSTNSSALPDAGWREYYKLYGTTNFYRMYSCPEVEHY
jgi:hypothetical protein